MIPLLVLPMTMLVALASSNCSDQNFCYRSLSRPPPHEDWGRPGKAYNRFNLHDKKPGPSWGGNNYPENGLVKPLRRDTRTPSPAGK
jgi:hypothetical protein